MSQPRERRGQRPRRILVAPQEFKGSLTAFEAAAALAEGVRRALPDAEVSELPMADGGPGTAEIVGRAGGGRMVGCTVHGPLGDPLEARYAFIEGAGESPLAVIECAAAAGLTLVPVERRDATLTTSYGVGDLIRDALERGARRLIVGVGGTGTNDGGSGVAYALGFGLSDPAGVGLPPGGLHLANLAHIEPPAVPLPRDVEVRIAVDVQNPLLGPEGATAVYGPQKGLRDFEAPAMEAALARWAEILRRDLGVDVSGVAGAGAGGGIPTGILACFPDARIESGAALVARAIGLPERIGAADLVLTGEGGLDGQTAYGKAVAHVIATAHEAGVPCVAVAGAVEGRPAHLADVEPLAGGASEREEAMSRAADLATEAAERVIRRWVGEG